MWLSIQGMYEYDPTIFNGLNLPTYTDDNQVVHSIDREALLNNILLECAELEVIYPKIETMRIAIAAWSVANQNKWQKLLATEYINYNPIWNVDADIIETEQRDISRVGSGSNNRTVNLADNETVNLSDNESVNLTDTESVKGFNSDTWAESKKNVKSGTDNTTRTGTDNITHTGTDNIALSDNETVDDDVTRTQRRTGNIGVTSTQDLIEKERNIAEFSIINYITLSFKERFCLLVY